MKPNLLASLHGTRTLIITRGVGDLISAEPHPDAIARWGQGSRVLSVNLPLTPRALDDTRVTRFFDNLMPEIGRAEIAAAHDTHNTLYDLLAAIGGDTAGALSVTEPDLPPQPNVYEYRPLTDIELVELVRNLPRRPFGDSGELRTSLAGVQGKLLLTKTADGGWALPINGSPSTHILKPEPLDAPLGSSANEALCTHLAVACGLTDVDVEYSQLADGRLVFATGRYDRQPSPDGPVRIHQEDLCQALGRPVGMKYEQPGERLLAATANLLHRYGGRDDLDRLLAITTLNVAIGNTDAHAKNLSLLHERNGDGITLAPIYDIGNHILDPRRPVEPAMHVNDVRSIHEITVADLIAEARSWPGRFPAKRAEMICQHTLSSIADHLAAAAGKWWVPANEDELLESISTRTANLANGSPAQPG